MAKTVIQIALVVLAVVLGSALIHFGVGYLTNGEGKEPRNYWSEPDVIRGPSQLRTRLQEKGITLEMTVNRSDLPSATIAIGQGFINEDEVGRELPFVVTQVTGDKVTLSKVAACSVTTSTTSRPWAPPASASGTSAPRRA